jgi:hypothetical protein
VSDTDYVNDTLRPLVNEIFEGTPTYLIHAAVREYLRDHVLTFDARSGKFGGEVIPFDQAASALTTFLVGTGNGGSRK